MKIQTIASISILSLGWLAAGPNPMLAKKITIDTAPVKQGRVFVNGNFSGIAPIVVDLKMGKNRAYAVRAEKDAALGLWTTEIAKDHKGIVMVRLEQDQAFQETVDSDVANTWLTVQPVRTVDEFKKVVEDQVWQKIVSVVTDNFSDLEQIDRSSFYLRTAWRMRRFPYSVMRNRLVVKRGVTPDLTVRVQLESQVYVASRGLRGGTLPSDQFRPTTRIFQDDSETIDYLRDQL